MSDGIGLAEAALLHWSGLSCVGSQCGRARSDWSADVSSWNAAAGWSPGRAGVPNSL